MTIDDLVNVYLILATGKYLDNWGAYGSCVDSVEDGQYWMVTTTGPSTSSDNAFSANTTFYTGICTPGDCKAEDMTNLDSLFVDAAIFNNVTDPYVSYFSVTEYVEDIQGSVTAGEGIMWIIILGLMGAAGAGTLLHITKFCDKPGIKERQQNTLDNQANNSNAAGNSEEYENIQGEGDIDPKEIQDEFNGDTALLYRKKTTALPLLAFSAIRNAFKLVTPQKNSQIHPQSISGEEKTLQLFDGMKFYAMLWIVYANTYAFTEVGVVSNIKNKPEFFKSFLFTIFPTAYFASDLFFYLSGFISIYVLLKIKVFTPVVILKQLFRRVWRLLPLMAFVLFTARFVLPRFIEGPQSQRYNEYFSECGSYWWTNLMLINNFYPAHLGSKCMTWTWYFSCETQLFAFMLLVAVVYKKNVAAGHAFSGFFIALGLILTSVLNGSADYTGANPYLDQKFFTDIYIKPYTRCVPYFMGVMMGARFYNYAKNSDSSFLFNKIKHNPLLRGLMYILGFAIMFTIVFVAFDYTRNYGTGWSTAAKTVYMTLSSLIFCAGIQLWIEPALLNRAKLLRFLFTGHILTLLGRVTYFVALAHPILMIGIYTTSGQPTYIESYKMFATFVGHAFLIYLIGCAIFLLVEGPTRALENIWYDNMFAQNRVENWLTVKNLDKKPVNGNGIYKGAAEEVKNN
jgi:peptidoglycan/LPS O-acetylase OafA/YrhL